MKSSSGEYFVALDHVRALAALMVFVWHFIHATNGYPVPFEYTPFVFPLSILNEGHAGVGLFMALSGYLFAKLLDGKQISYKQFWYNRVLRLAPLLFLVVVLVGIKKYLSGDEISSYIVKIIKGAIYPTLPNGGWSITTEFHFYLVLPLLLWLVSKSRWTLFVVLFTAIFIRVLLFNELGEIQTLSYWTIIGRIDQFILGIAAFVFHRSIAGRHELIIVTLVVYLLFYSWFDARGGFYQYPIYPSPSPLWIVLPTLEGAFFALMIAWYDSSFRHSRGPFSRFIAIIGTYSYSIYILHFFVVFAMARFVHEDLFDISNFYLSIVFALLCFLLMVPIGYLSYRFIEVPFLKLRTRYILS